LKKYKTATFLIEEDLLEQFRKEVKKSSYNQKGIINAYMKIIVNELKDLNDADDKNDKK
jgi:hypothetical protein